MNSFTKLMIGILLFSCSSDPKEENIDYRQEMRDLVGAIAGFARDQDPGFLVIPQNGHELLTLNGEHDGTPAATYLGAVSALGQEDLFYGYDNDNQATAPADVDYISGYLDVGLQVGKTILVTDYTWEPAKMDNSYTQNAQRGYISFAADDRELNRIPEYPDPIHNESATTVNGIDEIQNFLYLLNYEHYTTKAELLSDLAATNYDLIIMDAFFNDGTPFTTADLNEIRTKANSGSRLLIAYMSIGEAGDFRYYWQSGWHTGSPEWLEAENPDWAGNYKVRYWNQDWQAILYGNDNSYTQKILDAGFDGIYLDIIDAFWYFEEN